MEELFGRYPGAVSRTVALADELAFDLHKASPRLPSKGIPDGETPGSWLRVLTERGFRSRYAGTPLEREARARVDAELEVILRKGLRRLLRHRPRHRRVRAGARDPVPGARVAASSAVCFALGITAIDSVDHDFCSNGSSPSTARRTPTSISTSTPTGARRSSSASTRLRTSRRRPGLKWSATARRTAVRDAAKALGLSAGQQKAWRRRSTGGERGGAAGRSR